MNPIFVYLLFSFFFKIAPLSLYILTLQSKWEIYLPVLYALLAFLSHFSCYKQNSFITLALEFRVDLKNRYLYFKLAHLKHDCLAIL